jgi:hypothetical protein
MPRIIRPIGQGVRSAAEKLAVKALHGRVNHAKVDPRITFPCYKPFDDWIDVERLKSLDGYVMERVERHVQARRDDKFHTGPLTITAAAPKVAGSRIIYLSKSKRAFRYTDLNVADLWEPTEASVEFAQLMDFIRTLPFERTARMMIMYDASGSAVAAHRDHGAIRTCHEFVWFRTNKEKPFYMLNHRTGEKKYVESYSAWFDTCNQFHGADASGGLSVSIRVDGTFSDELRKRIPVPAYNAASTASLWACSEDRQ